MASFDKKKWLDDHVASIHPQIEMYAFFWNGDPPKEVLVYCKAKREPIDREKAAEAGAEAEAEAAEDTGAETSEGEVATWPDLVHILIEKGFRFDATRDVQVVEVDGSKHVLFGGDGCPMFNKEGMVTVRLLRKEEDGTNLIIELGHQYEVGTGAMDAVKQLFSSFDCDPLEVPRKYGTAFGAA